MAPLSARSAKYRFAAWVGLRYLKSKKSSRFLSFITVLSVLGVGLGVTSLIVVLCVMNGFEGEFEKRLMSTDLHILIEPTPQVTGFDNGQIPAAVFEATQAKYFLDNDHRIAGYTAVVAAEGMIRSGGQVAGVVVKGVNQARLDRLIRQVTESVDPRMLSEGQPDSRPPSIWIGKELSYSALDLIPGTEVNLVSPTESQGPLGGIPRIKRFVVEGVYDSKNQQMDLHTVFAHERAVYAFLRKRDVVTQWEVTLKDFYDAPQVRKQLQALLPGYRVQDWQQMNATLLASQKLERIAMFVSLAFIIVVASFNIMTTLTMMVLEKRKEIAILKAMGATKKLISRIFLAEGLFIGALGVGGGTALAWILCMALKRYEFIKLPEVYFDRTLPVSIEPYYFIVVSLSAFAIVLAACVYPSRRAAWLPPLESIRRG